MDTAWTKLPPDIINHILLYDRTIRHRNGKYINKIPNPDENYPLILERMRCQRYRRFYRNMSFVTIIIPNTEQKQICYCASNRGLTITLFEFDYSDDSSIKEELLFKNNNI